MRSPGPRRGGIDPWALRRRVNPTDRLPAIMTVRTPSSGGLPGALRLIVSVLAGAAIAFCALPAAVPAAGGEAAPDDGIALFEPCTRAQADRWAADAKRDGRAALRAASCYAVVVDREEKPSGGLDEARKGRAAAEAAIRHFPESGLAHYLAAYLTGLEAERAPWRGLFLVPVIEREAARAAVLSPGVDRAGPDRMLGELYLRAPAFPISVGDSRKAVTHYQRAVSRVPSAPENRLGLAESLLSDHRTAEACGELRSLLKEVAPERGERSVERKTRELLERHCGREGGR